MCKLTCLSDVNARPSESCPCSFPLIHFNCELHSNIFLWRTSYTSCTALTKSELNNFTIFKGHCAPIFKQHVRAAIDFFMLWILNEVYSYMMHKVVIYRIQLYDENFKWDACSFCVYWIKQKTSCALWAFYIYFNVIMAIKVWWIRVLFDSVSFSRWIVLALFEYRGTP